MSMINTFIIIVIDCYIFQFYNFRNDNIMEHVQKPTIHRLVTPDGFQLSTNSNSITRFSNQFLQSHFGSKKEFKQSLQLSLHNGKNYIHHNNNVEILDVIPVSRTRFNRATRSPLKCEVEFDALPITDYQQNDIREENADVIPLNSFGNKNRCKTCNKVSTFLKFGMQEKLGKASSQGDKFKKSSN